MDRRKELKAQYKQMKPDMGIFMIRCATSNKCYLEITQNLKGTINSAKFKLGAGAHPNKELQLDWQNLGESSFVIKVLENLEYDQDETKTDYREDLAILQMIWEERLSEQGLEFY
ncbi:MAG TPA: GIY-YIG nuclease family protein [Clostridia bacterium]|nr:GIY-YIG nuclease family protein [Clostridia bacterium]